jgi:dCTP deaminase
MTVLSSKALRERLYAEGAADPLVVRPLLDEQGQLKDGQASVDVRLGFEFCLVTASAYGTISEFAAPEQNLASFEGLYHRQYVPFGASLVIHPHQFVLAQTLEYLRVPADLMAYVVGRSTWGRLGLIVATAVGIHPGFAGSLTLELRNLGETPLTLYPGETIAQLFFHNVVGADGQPNKDAPKQAQYTGAVDMVPKQISGALTREKLKKLIDHFDVIAKT